MSEDKQIFLRNILIIGIIIVAVFILFQKGTFMKIEKEVKQKISQKIITPQITKTEASKLQKELPGKFLANFPLNGKTGILESYFATYPNSAAKQAVAVFESSKMPKENYDFYKKWAEKNKWNTINSSDSEFVKSLYIRKETEDLNVVIKGKTITVSYAKI